MLQNITVASTDIRALEAGILAKSGDTQQAMDAYRDLFESSPNRDTLLVLTRFQWKTGERMESVSRLEKWLGEHRDDLPVKLELANSYLALGRRDDAAVLYMEILEHSENNIVALNNLAWYLRKSDPEQALVYAKKASSVAPDSLTVMDTLAVVLLENGDTARAERLISRILDKAPGNPSFLYHRAMLMEEKGQKQEAVRILESLLKADAGFSGRAEAEQMLSRLRRGG
jgi:Flp pilus assembly protein TadD